MTPEEVKALSDGIKAKQNELKAAVEKKADSEAVDALKKELETLKTQLKESEIEELKKKNETLEQALVKQGEDIKQMQLGGGSLQGKSVSKEISEHKDALKSIAKKSGEGSNREIELKALTLRSNITDNEQAFDLPDIGQLATRKLTMYDIFPKLRVSSSNNNGVIRYYDWDEATIARAAAMVAEGDAFPQSTAKWKRYNLSIQKVGDTIPVTEEFFEDEEMFAAELGMFLETNVKLEIDDQICNGDGTGSNLTGLLASIDAYTAAASGITDANIYDLIVKVSEAITSTGGSKYSPDVAIMNITDINKMRLKKDQNNNYILPPFVSRDGKSVDTMLVIESNIVDANTMVVGDRRFARIYEKTGMEMSRGQINAQFTEDEWTLKVRARLAFLIRNADKGGFRKVTDITAALTTLAS